MMKIINPSSAIEKLLPVTLSFWISAAHHVIGDSRRPIAGHQTVFLRPNRHDDRAKCLRRLRSLRQSSPTGDQRQLIGEVLLSSAGQTSRRDTRAVKHRRFQLQQGDVVVECENVEIIVRNDFLDSLDFGVIPRDVMTANKCLMEIVFHYISVRCWKISLLVQILTRIS